MGTKIEEKQNELIQYLNGLLITRPPLPKHEWAKRQKLFRQIAKLKKGEESSQNEEPKDQYDYPLIAANNRTDQDRFQPMEDE